MSTTVKKEILKMYPRPNTPPPVYKPTNQTPANWHYVQGPPKEDHAKT
jgi:hypothetical protein